MSERRSPLSSDLSVMLSSFEAHFISFCMVSMFTEVEIIKNFKWGDQPPSAIFLSHLNVSKPSVRRVTWTRDTWELSMDWRERPCADTSQTASLMRSFNASMVFLRTSAFGRRHSNILSIYFSRHTLNNASFSKKSHQILSGDWFPPMTADKLKTKMSKLPDLLKVLETLWNISKFKNNSVQVEWVAVGARKIKSRTCFSRRNFEKPAGIFKNRISRYI